MKYTVQYTTAQRITVFTHTEHTYRMYEMLLIFYNSKVCSTAYYIKNYYKCFPHKFAVLVCVAVYALTPGSVVLE